MAYYIMPCVNIYIYLHVHTVLLISLYVHTACYVCHNLEQICVFIILDIFFLNVNDIIFYVIIV